MALKTLTLAAGIVLATAGIASAATVTGDLNLRSGPGTNYRVIDTMPAGAYVHVIGCGGAWCRVDWRGEVGYASARYIGGGGDYVDEPVYAPPPPIFGFGFGFGGPRWHHGWHHGWHHHH
jgi:uncharacterized protein YraI